MDVCAIGNKKTRKRIALLYKSATSTCQARCVIDTRWRLAVRLTHSCIGQLVKGRSGTLLCGRTTALVCYFIKRMLSIYETFVSLVCLACLAITWALQSGPKLKESYRVTLVCPLPLSVCFYYISNSRFFF